MRYIKIFGIEMSGTGFLEFILRSHLDARILLDNFGWRHGLPMDAEKYLNSGDCPPSMMDEMRGIMIDPGFINFVIIIRDPYKWYHPAKLNLREWDIIRAYQKYNRLYTGYMHLLMSNQGFFRDGVMVRFEDINKNVDGLIQSISTKYGLTPHYPSRRIIYPSKDAFPVIHDEEITLINRLVSDDVFKFYGYEKQ